LAVAWQGGAILLLAAAIALAVNQLRAGSLPLVADWSPKARLATGAGVNLEISFEDAQALFFAGAALFLDARSPQEYAAGHIQGALNLPWETFGDAFAQVMSGLPQDAAVVTYCDGETCALSRDLAFSLLQAGYFDVRVLVNGWSRWLDSHLPVTTGGKP
jgi:rhodanese-related sulfurtransferase